MKNVLKAILTPDDADDAVLTIAEAARWANRSEAWVRTWRASGPLEPAEVDGLQGVTLASLRVFAAKRARPRRRPKLRLVVDNS